MAVSRDPRDMMRLAMQAHDVSEVRVAIASEALQRRLHLEAALEHSGFRVVLSEPLSELFLSKLDGKRADVLILDIDEGFDHGTGFLERLLERTDLPIVFNDVSALAIQEPAEHGAWYGKLVRKIAELTGQPTDCPLSVSDAVAMSSGQWELAQSGMARNVWVLGASLGGPQAVKRFLAALPARLPVAFVLAQHLGANFVGLLADQLNRCGSVRVLTPKFGHLLRHGQMIVAPVDERLVISPVGRLELHPLEAPLPYSPSIDSVMTDIAVRYKEAAGAIVFTGMGDDGARGCRAVAAHGGTVWAQAADSCVISSMPDKARATGLVGYSGSPEELAQRLAAYLNERGEI